MVRIPVFNYVCRTPNRDIHVPTFKATTANQGRLMGTIVAPEGTSVYQSQAITSTPKLKIPKDSREGEFWLLDVADAITSARAGHYGLRWEPARAEAAVR